MRPVMKKVASTYQAVVLLTPLFLLPITSVFAESVPEESLEEHPAIASPTAEYFTEETTPPPRFFFQHARMTGIVNEPLPITLFSDQEVEEARIKLPKEAQLQTDGLPTGMTAHKEEATQEWVLHVPRAHATFVLPVVFEVKGEFTVSSGELTAIINVKDTSNFSISEEEQELSDEEDQTIENQINVTELLNEKYRPEVSFVVDTFSAKKGQRIGLQILNQVEKKEFTVRIPYEADIDSAHLEKSIEITHSHEDYWTIQLDESQELIEIPITFNKSGYFFISVDDDNSHIFLQITEETIPASKKEIKATREANLVLPKKMIEDEENRILKNVHAVDSRDTNVNNWSQLRSIWNSTNSQHNSIRPSQSINFSSSILGDSLRERTNRVELRTLSGNPHTINVGTSGNSFLTSASIILDNIIIMSESSGTVSLIRAADLRLSNTRIINRRSAPAIAVPTNGHAELRSSSSNIVFNQQAVSPIHLSGTARLTISSAAVIGSSNILSNVLRPPITSSANSTISINARNVMMGGRINAAATGAVNHLTTYRVPWNSVNATLTGVNASTVTNSVSDPNDFSERYLLNHNLVDYRSLTTAAGASDGFVPPVPTYTLSLQANPAEGGNPTAITNTLTTGSTTTLSANPAANYRFVRWEIVSGTGSTIQNVNSASTTFTMGRANTTVRAVYERILGEVVTVEYLDEDQNDLLEKKYLRGFLGDSYETTPEEIDNYVLIEQPSNAFGIFTEQEQTVTYIYRQEKAKPLPPLDPLDPDLEVDPENKPELPEDQGLLSIDFISSFNFGSQVLSVHDQVYYAQPQRLLNPDGTVNKSEERPNYVQISDRRPEGSRHGWQLAVRQNGQFETATGEELQGASIGLTNQQLATVQGGVEPSLQESNPLTLVPNTRRVLVMAQGNEGAGTWIYRFGDRDTAGESVSLTVPKGATPSADTYRTTLIWELAAVPENE